MIFMPALLDWVGNPVAVIDDIFGNDSECYSEKILEYFLAKIKDPHEESNIPLIKLNHQPASNLRHTLVKAYCMIQDILNPSFYFETFNLNLTNSKLNTEVKSKKLCGKYKNCIDFSYLCKDKLIKDYSSIMEIALMSLNEQSSHNKISELLNYVVIHPPGLNKWVNYLTFNKDLSNYEERDGFQIKFDKSEINYMIKIYDQPKESYKIKLNDIVKVYGILSWNETSPNELIKEKYKALENSYEIHVIRYIALESHEINCFPQTILDTKMDFAQIYGEFLDFIHKALQMLNLNDKLLAQYLSLFLLIREPSNLPSQKHLEPNTSYHQLTISFPPDDVTNRIELINNLTKLVLPASQHLKFGLADLNLKPIYPTKSYDGEIKVDQDGICSTEERREMSTLAPTPLQLAPHTFVTVDMTTIKPSDTFTDTGLANVRVLRELLSSRHLEYDFKFYPLHMDSKLKLLLVTCGEMAQFLGVNNALPLKFDDQNVPSTASRDIDESQLAQLISKEWGDGKLDYFRHYVAKVNSMSADPTKSPSTTTGRGRLLEKDREDIINDFVTMRSRDVSEMSADDMQRHLMLTKCLSVCKGEDMTFQNWQEIKKWESERKFRS